LTEKTTQIHK